MNIINIDYRNNTNFVRTVMIFTFIVIVNIMTIGNISNLVVTLPQYFLVLCYLAKGDIRNSVMLHFAFTILSLSVQKTFGMFDDKDIMLYNYGTVKLIGPIRACYALNILFTLILLKASGFKMSKNTTYYKLYRVFLYLFITGCIIGGIGVLFHPYYFADKLLDKSIYAFVVATSMYILLKVSNIRFMSSAYYVCLAAIMAGIIGSFICFFVGGVVSHYSIFDIAYMSDITFLTPLLIIGVIAVKQKLLLYGTLAIYLFFISSVLAGKEVFSIAFCLLALLYCYFFKTEPKHRNGIMTFSIVMLAAVFVFTATYLGSGMGETMASYKMQSAMSMFSGNADEVSRSPYIRMAQLANILYEGLLNPLTLIFGNGYGGYFEDKLNLLSKVDLLNGAYNYDIVKTGRFPSGHDAIVNIPFFNGIIGTILVLKIAWVYIKRIPRNYLNGAIFLWVLLVFYFNTLFAYIGLFALYAAEYDINNVEKSNKYKYNIIK